MKKNKNFLIKKLLQEQFEKRVEEFYKDRGELTSGYFDFLYTYLMCCSFIIKYRNDFEYKFPPTDEEYIIFSDIVIESYGSKTIKDIEKLKRNYPLRDEFLKDVKNRFNNVPLKKEESFIRLTYHCIFMVILLEVWLPIVTGPLPRIKSPYKEYKEAADIFKKKNVNIEKVINGWGFDLVCRAWELIGYWEKNMKAKESAKKGGEKREEKKQERIKNVRDKIENKGKFTDKGFEVKKDDWFKILYDVFGYNYVSSPTSKSYIEWVGKLLSEDMNKEIIIILEK